MTFSIVARIGDAYGVTRERIRQLEAKIITKLQSPLRSDVLRPFY